jgi:hypothetical protein
MMSKGDRAEFSGGEGMGEWKEIVIEDICKKVVSGGTPLTSRKEYQGTSKNRKSLCRFF